MSVFVTSGSRLSSLTFIFSLPCPLDYCFDIKSSRKEEVGCLSECFNVSQHKLCFRVSFLSARSSQPERSFSFSFIRTCALTSLGLKLHSWIIRLFVFVVFVSLCIRSFSDESEAKSSRSKKTKREKFNILGSIIHANYGYIVKKVNHVRPQKIS